MIEVVNIYFYYFGIICIILALFNNIIRHNENAVCYYLLGIADFLMSIITPPNL
jgi:hypothetical protein